uniref:Uncharacterized protein n=1 Tax=Ditylenchus dipsaci TaxID=166011 RepID=A0A915ESU4_9BILA
MMTCSFDRKVDFAIDGICPSKVRSSSKAPHFSLQRTISTIFLGPSPKAMELLLSCGIQTALILKIQEPLNLSDMT